MASRRHPEGMKLFALAANCLLQGEVMNTCAPAFTYPPAFAFFMIPFGPPPHRRILWLSTWCLPGKAVNIQVLA
jgi:hypothetical protein